MATLCVDISADKNLTNASPLAMYAFIICYIITNMLMKPDFLFLIIILIELVLCQVFFQFSPRMVFITMQFLGKQEHLSPTVEDEKYVANEELIKPLKKILKNVE